jgi:hypothetical protein
MNRKPRATVAILIATTCGLVSCATMRKVGQNSVAAVGKAGSGSVAAVKNSTSAALSKMSDLPMAHLLPGQGPKVVEVREKELKEMPTGTELAKAHKQRNSGFWIFGGPVDIPEPVLPEAGAELDGSLLPPPMP